MENNTGTENAEDPTGSADEAKVYENDPYPKMIIVCIFISLFLLFLIALVLMMDFGLRDATQEIRPQNPAFFEENLDELPQ